MSHERTAMLEDRVMEAALMADNWEYALHAVESNDGAPGPDGMKAKELRAHLATHGEVIRRRLLEGSYKPGPHGAVTSRSPAVAPVR
jgi:RNA-directed DNA polymerase